MIRNLKILIAAAMALALLGALNVSGAQAAEFHCSVEPCKVTVLPDGTPGAAGKTAHQVFVFKQGASSLSTTCQKVEGNGTVVTKTFKTLQLGNLVYSNCDIGGTGSTVKMNGCEYHYVTPGIAPHNATMQINCPAGKVIEREVTATGCKLTIGSTGALGGGLKFHDAETGGVKKELVTMETTVTGIPATVNNGCSGFGFSAGAATVEYTTGNVELTGGTTAGVMGTLWWE